MSKNSKSRSKGSKKKKSKSKARSSRQYNNRSEQQKNIEQIEQTAPEQLNNDIPEKKEPEPEVEIKAYEPEADTSVSSDAVEIKPEEQIEETVSYDDETRSFDEETESFDEGNEQAEEKVTEEETEPEAVEDESEQETGQEPVEEEEESVSEETTEEVIEEEPVPQQVPKRHKKHTGLKVIGAMALIMVYCCVALYGIFWIDDNIIDPDIFPNGTTLNGVDVSGMDRDEARKALTDDWNTHSISIFNVYGKEIGELKDFDFEYDINDQLEHALSPGAERAIYRFFQRKKDDISIKMNPAGSTKKFKKQFGNLSIVKEAKGDKPSKNAYIDKSDTEFRIVKEVIGNSVDTKLLRNAIFEAISNGDEVFNFRRSDFHKAPKIISTSKSLLKEREYCIKYLSFKIRLRNPVNDYTIPPSWLDKMIKVKDNGKVKIKEDNISEFISEVLYPKFSSVGDTRTLKSAGGGKYTISGGTYGYTIDVEKEQKALTSDLKDREDVEREPHYAGRTPDNDWKNDIGDDFIEVSISKQTCWVVRHGKVIVETPVVTGVLPRHATPTGVYYIVYKATNTTLKGRNDDGSKYESHVNYWMPFYLGFGLHDANWRGVFGGTIYVHGGSHGCVNCPPAIMPKIFSNSYEGMPVIVH